MTRLTRRVIFYGLVAIFVLITPPIIFYAMGYSFDWGTKSLVQTGGFYLKSLPDNAAIIIDGKNKKTTPRLISRLAPKTYSVTVAKDGFSTWQKNLAIEAQMVVEARNIILFPENIISEKISGNVTSTISDWLTSSQDLFSRQQSQNLASSSAGWLNRGLDIFYLDRANYILYRRDRSGFIKEQISREPLPKDTYKLSVSSNNRFLAQDNQKNLYLLNMDSGIFEQIGNQVKDAFFSGDNKKILLRTTNELWILYLEDVLIQPYKKASEKELITRLSQNITQAIFYPDNEHVAFVVGDQIKITELDGRDQRNTIDFITAPSPQIYFDQASSSFYYLTRNELFRVKLEL